jgi:hypothetical protein
MALRTFCPTAEEVNSLNTDIVSWWCYINIKSFSALWTLPAGSKSSRQHSASHKISDSSDFPASFLHDLASVSTASADSLSMYSAP